MKVPVTYEGKTAYLNFFPPRPYQEEAVSSWIANNYFGAVQLPTGAGKTFVALLAWKALGFPRMVIVVPTNSLKLSHLTELTDVIGVPKDWITTDPRVRDGLVAIVTYQLLTMRPELVDELINRGYTFWVVDESHHVAGEKFFERVFQEAKKRKIKLLGLSATPHGGGYYVEELKSELPIVYRKTWADIKEYLAPLELYLVSCHLSPKSEEEYQKAYAEYKKLMQYFLRHYGTMNLNWIVRTYPGEYEKVARFRSLFNQLRALTTFVPSKDRAVVKILKAYPDEKAIVFSERQDQLIKLFKDLKDMGIKGFPLVGKTVKNKKFEQEVLNAFRTGKIRVLGLVKKGGEGVNIPDASIGIIVSTPKNSKTNIQRVGRLIRKREGKVARIFYLYVPGTEEQDIAKNLTKILHPDEVFYTTCENPAKVETSYKPAQEKREEVPEENREYLRAVKVIRERLEKVRKLKEEYQAKLEKLSENARPTDISYWSRVGQEVAKAKAKVRYADKMEELAKVLMKYALEAAKGKADERTFKKDILKLGATRKDVEVLANGYTDLFPLPRVKLTDWIGGGNAER